MRLSTKLSLGIIAISTFSISATAGFAQGESGATSRIEKTDTPSSTLAKDKLDSSQKSFRGVSFKNANKIEFKYKERIKNFKEQLQMGIKKGWLSEKEVVEFKEKIDVLEKTEKAVSSKNYPKLELDKMEKMFTLYNQEFYKASNTPMEKKTSEKTTSPKKTSDKKNKTTVKSKTVEKKKGSK